METLVKEYDKLFKELEELVNSDLNWEQKAWLTFGTLAKPIQASPLWKAHFPTGYYDPDMGYAADTRAFFEAAKEVTKSKYYQNLLNKDSLTSE